MFHGEPTNRLHTSQIHTVNRRRKRETRCPYGCPDCKPGTKTAGSGKLCPWACPSRPMEWLVAHRGTPEKIRPLGQPAGLSSRTSVRGGRPLARASRHEERSSSRHSFTLTMSRYDTGHGSTFQMSVAYSLIVRSLENLPELAIFRIALRAQSSDWAYSSTSRRSASR